MRRILALLLLPFVAGVLTLPALAGASAKTASVRAQDRPVVSDTQLDATLRAKLAKSKIGKDGFHFRVQRGVVTWEGTTSVPQHKGAATRMARSSGALQVINNIKVGRKPGAPLRKAYVQP
ncbi:MAG TPA: BON domain-containing protein [Bryobacteraceae bacterium]|jgi:osmotically-inducible protein OsmY